MKKISRISICVALLVVFAWVPANAQTIMQKAKEEGKVVWYSSLTLKIAQEVCNLFNSKKMGIECVLHRSGSGKLYRRWTQEAKSGIYSADVLHTSNIAHFLALRKKKNIIKYRPEGTKGFNPNFVEKDNYWTVLRASFYAPTYNTKKIKAADVPKSWKDFLDPKWKNKLVHAHPSYSGFVTVGMIAMVDKFGWEYYEQLKKLNPRIVQSASDSVNFVVRGEASISGGGVAYGAYNAIKKGEPIKIIYPKEGLPFVASANAIFTKAPHPNAAKVFVDFLFTQEVQQLLVKRGLYVGHSKVKYPEGQIPLKDVKAIIVPPSKVAKERKSVRKKFREIFGV
ncbi:MAG: extracellular solute-binding protein [Deltaproteobacteria bacterium]|nr:extracellular solute-binding protein [Deltaproteobacteria bacterium]